MLLIFTVTNNDAEDIRMLQRMLYFPLRSHDVKKWKTSSIMLVTSAYA